MQKTFPSYQEAFETLPNGSAWSCSFGHAGEGGFNEYWRAPNGETFVIGNGRWDDTAPFTWTVTKPVKVDKDHPATVEIIIS